MKRILLVAGAVVVLLAAGLVAFALYRKHQGRNIRGSSTEFVSTQAAPKPPPVTSKIRWPMYRFDPTRQGNAEKMLVEPPYKPLWFFRAGSLVEFPPAVAYGKLYFANSKGVLFAVDIAKVRTVWAYRARRCTAASPAVDNHTVYMTFLNKPPCNATRSGLDGEVVALNADTGKIRWRLKIGPTESSPLVDHGTVYVGDWTGKLYALSAASGATRWTFQTGDKIKGAVALSGGRVYFGSYDHHVYAVDAKSGTLVWTVDTLEPVVSSKANRSTPMATAGPCIHARDRARSPVRCAS